MANYTCAIRTNYFHVSMTLNEIAKKNGYDCCNWSSREIDGEIKVTFKKRKRGVQMQ